MHYGLAYTYVTIKSGFQSFTVADMAVDVF